LKIDVHCHVAKRANRASRGWTNADLIEAADKLGIDKLLCSTPVSRGQPTMKMVRECNDITYEAMKEYPDRPRCRYQSSGTQATLPARKRLSDGGSQGSQMGFTSLPSRERCPTPS